MQIVSDSIYIDNDHYLKFCILPSIVFHNSESMQARLSTSTSWGLWQKQRLLSFQNEHLFVFKDKQSIQYHKSIWFDELSILDKAIT